MAGCCRRARTRPLLAGVEERVEDLRSEEVTLLDPRDKKPGISLFENLEEFGRNFFATTEAKLLAVERAIAEFFGKLCNGRVIDHVEIGLRNQCRCKKIGLLLIKQVRAGVSGLVHESEHRLPPSAYDCNLRLYVLREIYSGVSAEAERLS